MKVVLDEVRNLLATDPETLGLDAIELPYRAHVYWTRPRAIPRVATGDEVGRLDRRATH